METTGKRLKAAGRAAGLVAIVAVVSILYFASPILIPLALALLLCFLLAPVVMRLERLRVPRVLAVLMVSAAATLGLVLIGQILLTQIVDLADQLPRYRQNLREKMHTLRSGSIDRALKGAKDISREISEATAPPPEDPSATAPATTSEAQTGREALTAGEDDATEPVEVRLAEPEMDMVAVLGSGAQLLATIGLTLVLMVFMLIERESLRDRIVHLMGRRRLYVTTVAFDDASRRIGRVLATQLLINVMYGAPVGLGLWLLGVPNAMLWGVLAVFLRFIPYVGAWIVASGPILLSLAVFDDWPRPLMVIGLFVVIELLINNVVEPLLYGSQMGVSSLAVLISVLFWTWLWGPAGLLLALPMTACVMVAAQHVPQLKFLDVLLSDKPDLPVFSRLYQRLLAMDSHETKKIVEEYLKEHSLTDLFDQVLLPALSLGERDRHSGALDDERGRYIVKHLGELIEHAEREHGRIAATKAPPADAPASTPETSPLRRMALVVAAHDEADDLSARMLRHVLLQRGVEVSLVPSSALVAEVIQAIQEQRPNIVYIASVPPNAIWHTHRLCRRLRISDESTVTVLCLWTMRAGERTADRLKSCGVKRIARTLKEAVEAV